jgi:hypothetical protein
LRAGEAFFKAIVGHGCSHENGMTVSPINQGAADLRADFRS